ncbi:PHP domain-containing protein [Flavobacteriaceae bacterium F89]|uniref:PHP domain-containing protein n=1 Tax=Cerina litoralis TaxID=2874477 RepID=A0AAE3JPQ3_9FLAO|nr:Sb-PDE family phosphodiesterase [Cerina litoralis]MCG2462360.1 PHP domain-containing protein [Cerina litoralis]
MRNLFFMLFALLDAFGLVAQNLNRVTESDVLNQRERHEIRMPHIEGIEIMRCDFHIHTVFSDGYVWPTTRVEEAWYDGLDAIAITDHVEFRPHKNYLPDSLNDVFAIAKPVADYYGILLIKGAEITRSMPPGHINAIFLKDIDALGMDDYMEAIEEAHNQGAYIFWNHPGWKVQQSVTKWWDVHDILVKNGWMQGVEVYNTNEWYPVALEWCLEKNLTYMANSDIHGTISYVFDTKKDPLRPMTLVFVKERGEQALKDALMKGNAVAFFAGKLAGPEVLLRQIFEASVVVGKRFNVIENGDVSIKISNLTDIPFVLEDEEGKNLILAPGTTVIIKVEDYHNKKSLKFKVTNLYYGMNKNLDVEMTF